MINFLYNNSIIINQLILLTILFIIIMYMQYIEDYKYNVTRTSLYEKYKVPIFIIACVGLVMNINIIDIILTKYKPHTTINLIDGSMITNRCLPNMFTTFPPPI